MKIHKVKLSNLRGYENAEIELSPSINLIVGENNSGKTTILRTLLLLQDRGSISIHDTRTKEDIGGVMLTFKGDVYKYFDPVIANSIDNNTYLEITISNEGLSFNGNNFQQNCILNVEPRNFIYPFLSKRKVTEFNESINLHYSNSVIGNFSNLYAKVDRITTDGLPAKNEYVKACRDIFGFQISSLPSNVGKKSVYIVDNFRHIPLERMGEGIVNILGLILDLCMAEDQLFLIEEPENDIHPNALKKLLSFILEKSKTNQFVITTHSNIVLKYLGSEELSKIFKVNMEFVDKIPTSSITEVDNSPEARREILEDLGYELFDFDVWDTWLILEESSAEVIIREFIIPNFVPGLKERLKICSSDGVERVPERFYALHSLCLFFHLQKTFDQKIWVLVDGGENETRIINDLKNKYKSWNKDSFCQLKQHDFEKYYPEEFQAEVDKVLQIPDKKEKRNKKRILLNNVKKWYTENPGIAKEAFSKSACEVIDILKNIEKVVAKY
ncbi:ATP-dependent nuclease [Nostoc sp. ChiSLP03a]|uniref:ATP-dependent nuclease n=1 Tax=Nostoc sp. ChiSLP03a TaxID=3075380 RepID=UPI002AD526C9|nr:AAA family ATPase [Nostoc sp. ChiSLP03a]MDZ8211638.1 AAA family ATPase [Nostoc sp. ChiSLP03a]